MRTSIHALTGFAAALALAALTALPAASQPLAAATSPQSVGFDSARLKRLDDYMAGVVAQGRVAGMTTLLARHGKIVAFNTYGQADLAGQRPMEKDAIFRIYSMSKPITGVAMMILFEEGKWRLEDPVTKFIPEFKNLQVMTGLDSQGGIATEPMKRSPTMRELMSHTAGFGYGLSDNSPIDRLLKEKKALGSTSLHQMIERIATVPLKYQPGTDWAYSAAVDIQGYIVEKLSGQSLGAFMEARIFRPLKMTDTAFQLPPDKKSRFAQVYAGDPATGKITLATAGPSGAAIRDYTKPPSMESGGGGLASTTADYARFSQMVLNKGELDGARILSPATIELMDTNVVPQDVLAKLQARGGTRFNEAVGFGLDFALVMDPRKAGSLEGKDSMTWDGAAGTWFWVDPTNDLIFVGMVQRMGGLPGDELAKQSRTLTYQALVDPRK